MPQLLKCPEPVLRNKRSHCNEKPVPPLSTTRESLLAARKIQRSQKNKT